MRITLLRGTRGRARSARHGAVLARVSSRHPINSAMRTDVDDMTSAAPPTTRPTDMRGLRAFVRLMDDAIVIPGTNFRIGLDALIGLIPGVGDMAGGVLSAAVIIAAARSGAPSALVARMVGNAGLDMIFGAVPIIGDLFDAGWKANRRNLNLLERYLEKPTDTRRASTLLVVGAVAALALLVVASVAAAIWITRALLRAGAP